MKALDLSFEEYWKNKENRTRLVPHYITWYWHWNCNDFCQVKRQTSWAKVTAWLLTETFSCFAFSVNIVKDDILNGLHSYYRRQKKDDALSSLVQIVFLCNYYLSVERENRKPLLSPKGASPAIIKVQSSSDSVGRWRPTLASYKYSRNFYAWFNACVKF